MNNNLVPTPIVNKNGISTTVYKRGTTNAPEGIKAVPGPSINNKAVKSETPKLDPVVRTALVDELVAKYVRSENPFGMLSNEIEEAFRNQLEEYSDELVSKLYMGSQRSDNRNGTFLLAKENRSEAYMLTYLYFVENQYERIFEEGRGLCFFTSDAMNAIVEYPQLPYEHTPEYYQKALALTGVVAKIQSRIPAEEHFGANKEARLISYTRNDHVEKVARIANDDLTELILEKPERWEDIADIITERQTDDVVFIRSILDSDTSSVREGTL